MDYVDIQVVPLEGYEDNPNFVDIIINGESMGKYIRSFECRWAVDEAPSVKIELAKGATLMPEPVKMQVRELLPAIPKE